MTENFLLNELIATNTGLANEPNEIERQKLLYLAIYILQPIRNEWGRLQITSGFRSEAVNIAIGGQSTSQHRLGEAADFIPLGFNNIAIQDPVKYMDTVFEWIVKRSNLKYGQCIRESKNGKNWIHISLVRYGRPNQQALTYDGKEFKTYV